MSSTTGGGPGQVDYCAANAYLDIYARKNFTKHGMTIAVNWGEWQWDAWDAGLQGYPQEAQVYFREKRQKFGISFEEGSEALRRILSRKLPQVVVSTADFPTIVESSRHFSIATILERLKEFRQSRPGYARPVLDTSYMAPRNDLECQVATIWSELLGITEIGMHDNFFELGGNSLMGTQLVSRLRSTFEVDMSLATIFQALTVEELALNIKLMLLDEIDQLDEEEVKHLA
jgi:acyl carrier protein